MATINDVVLIYIEDAPVSFARVESILPDAKKDWYHIKLLMLQIPLQVITWILKDDYINGDTFHMNGKQMRLQKVESPIDELPFIGKTQSSDTIKQKETDIKNNTSAQIISFSELKKNHEPDDDAG